METTLTTQQKLDILTNDFLERDGNTFVKIRRTGRLGWENTLPENGSYSSFITGNSSPEDLIKNAYQLACNMVTVMNHKERVHVRISAENSCTDGKSLFVATKVFDDKELTPGQKADTFIGLAVHEGCHLLYTDFDAPQGSNRTVKNLANIIEDERIERLCGEDKPGLANFIGVTKYYYFDKLFHDNQKIGNYANLSALQRFVNCLLKYVRYPKNLTVTELEEFCDRMIQVKDILTPFPASTSESTLAAEKIYLLIEDLIQKDQEKNSGGENSNGNSNSNHESHKQKDLDELNRILELLAKDACQEPDENDESEIIKTEDGKVAKICQGEMERGTLRNSYVKKATENENIYREALDNIKKYVPAIGKAIKCETTSTSLTVKGMRNGILDASKIVEGSLGVQTVFMKKGQIKSNRTAVCILIDESGSMWGEGEKAARQTAVLLNEALMKTPSVDLYIYGHTASRNSTDLYVYREKGFNKRYALGSTDSRSGNHDSIAIREAAARVRKFTSEKCLFFVISDGAPNEPTEKVRQAVKDIEKDGFNVVAISIDPYYDPSTMYDHNVNLTDLSRLAIDLGKMVKQSILKNTKKTVTY